MKILVTGGTGFIGSHTCVALLDAGFDIVVLDNLCNSDASVIERIGHICGREPVFIEGDIRDATNCSLTCLPNTRYQPFCTLPV